MATVVDPFAYVVVLNLAVEYLPMRLLTHIEDLEHSQAAVLRKWLGRTELNRR